MIPAPRVATEAGGDEEEGVEAISRAWGRRPASWLDGPGDRAATPSDSVVLGRADPGREGRSAGGSCARDVCAEGSWPEGSRAVRSPASEGSSDAPGGSVSGGLPGRSRPSPACRPASPALACGAGCVSTWAPPGPSAHAAGAASSRDATARAQEVRSLGITAPASHAWT